MFSWSAPASAQHSSEITKNTSTMPRRDSLIEAAERDRPAHGAEADRQDAEHVAHRRRRDLDHRDLDARALMREREARVALMREQPEDCDVDDAEQAEDDGGLVPAVRGQRCPYRGGERGHPFHPFATASMPVPLVERSLNIARTRAGAATNRTISPWSTWTMSAGTCPGWRRLGVRAADVQGAEQQPGEDDPERPGPAEQRDRDAVGPVGAVAVGRELGAVPWMTAAAARPARPPEPAASPRSRPLDVDSRAPGRPGLAPTVRNWNPMVLREAARRRRPAAARAIRKPSSTCGGGPPTCAKVALSWMTGAIWLDWPGCCRQSPGARAGTSAGHT